MTDPEKTYSAAEIATRLKALPGWRFENGALARSYQTDGWPTTLMLVNALGFIAEAADHHPDLAVSWGSVSVRLNTHSAKGITDKDFELARRFEAAAMWRPGSGDPFRGTTKKWVTG
ncbi:MAG TPA: 4a-hydroxytetrahydrobiopterin dehydratase [Gemmatimonadales bacterium]|nr:4a-hydroxytetrahydrobiopterin dehydratase [Gemmatimonadales bacterium]